MPKRKKIALISGIAVLVAVFVGVALWNATHQQGGGIPRNAAVVEIEAAHKETIVCKANVKGTAELSDVTTIFPRAASRVKEVHVKAGDTVSVGQRLLDYDSDALDELKDSLEDARLALRSAELSLEAARTPAPESERIRMENARSDYERVKTLFDEGAASKKELDAAYEAMRQAEDQVSASGDSSKNRAESAEVAVEQAKSQISRLQQEIDKHDEFEAAPASGTVISVSVKDGDVSAPGRPLFEIADVSAGNMIVKANVPENDARALAIGQKAELRCDAIGREAFSGEVARISPVAEKKQVGNAMETALTVEIRCDEPGLKAGYSVNAVIVTRTVEDAVVIPLMATVSASDGNNYVYVMREDFSVEKRAVDLGEYSGIYVEALNVAAGEKLVLSPPAQLEEGSFVRPVATRQEPGAAQ
ncbi:MAG: efflux RND transporter periplasmic adaptor subunit [Clostridiales Family XIII bacterium]|jgi:RND family efflux transporter MFP subunit|nr:efflux RND transporter periplasmic adaptor subunit [Clostridiales Family XIII bacterium]